MVAAPNAGTRTHRRDPSLTKTSLTKTSLASGFPTSLAPPELPRKKVRATFQIDLRPGRNGRLCQSFGRKKNRVSATRAATNAEPGFWRCDRGRQRSAIGHQTDLPGRTGNVRCSG